MARLLLLHLLPAVLWLIFYIPFARIASAKGIPTMFVFYILFALIVVPFEMGFLYYQGKKMNGRLSLKRVVLFREKMPWWQYLLFGLISVVWAVLIFLGSSPIMDFLRTTLFSWIPDWFYLTRGSVEQNAPSIEITMWILGFVFMAIIGPLVEELYFRGYLLPRLSKLGKWAPLVNVTLFIIYHFWQPNVLVTMIIAMLPLIYFVWWKKNIYLGIGVHCFSNSFAMITDLLERLGHPLGG